MQARLPDINAAFTKHRNEAIASLKSGNYDSVFGALYALNGLLPSVEENGKQKYRIIISDIEYNRLAQRKILVKCRFCEAEQDIKTVKFYELLLPFIDRVLSKSKTVKVWTCTKKVCRKENQFLKSEVIEEVNKEPFYLGVVPKPPRREDGLSDRSDYHRKIIQWAWTFLYELEESMARFRDDNWQKEDTLFDVDYDFGEQEEK